MACAAVRAETVDTIMIADEPFTAFVDVFAHARRFVHTIARLANASLVEIPATVLIGLRTGTVHRTRPLHQGQRR